MKASTSHELIIKHLQNHGSITFSEAKEYGVRELAICIQKLRTYGHRINTIRVDGEQFIYALNLGAL